MPEAPFLPCLGPNTELPVIIVSGADTVRREVRAEEVSFPVTIQEKDYALVSEAALRGCALLLQEPGDYVAVPFRSDRPWPDPARPVDIQLSYGALPVPITLPLEVTSGQAESTGTANLRIDYRDAPQGGAASSASARTCPFPTAVGDSLLFYAQRNEKGELIWDGALTEREHWRLVAFTRDFAVFMDSVSLRMMDGDPTLWRKTEEIFSIYEEMTADIFRNLLPPPPDRDGNGKVILLLSGKVSISAPPGFAAGGTLRPDCEAQEGELVFMDLRFQSLLGSASGPFAGILTHEMAHIVDFAGGNRHVAPWAREGFARLVEIFAMERDNPRPLASNFSKERTINGSGFHCAYTARPMNLSNPYGIGCFRLGYAMDLAMREKGLSLREAVAQYLTMRPAYTFMDVRNGFAGKTLPEDETTAEWYLSWYLDDRIETGRPTLENRTWNTLAIQNSFAMESLRLPDKVLRAGRRFEARLQEPDVRFIELTVAPATQMPLYLSTRGEGGRPTELVLFRMR